MVHSAHQRRIREEMAVANPRPAALSLDGYAVETISRADATPIIMHYEWLRSVGKTYIFVGLISPSREIEGVACFGHGPSGSIRNIIGSPALCLERGACVHYAPPNAASFLIAAACKLVYRIHGVARFFAYADPMAGEYGAVYQAAGWLYIGQGLDGGNGRKRRYYVLRPKDDPNVASNWKTTRTLRRGKDKAKWLTVGAAEAQGWRIGSRAGKHVYATNVERDTRDRKRWRKEVIAGLPKCLPLPFPAPRPELKRRAAIRTAEARFRVPSPDLLQSCLL
jgi:hypothetical protein